MCVRVQGATNVTDPWNPSQRTILIPAGLDLLHRLQAVRAVLTELGVSQPRYGAVCWCGEPVTFRQLIPAQRTPSD